MPSVQFKDMNMGNYCYPHPPMNMANNHYYSTFSQPSFNNLHHQIPPFSQNQ